MLPNKLINTAPLASMGPARAEDFWAKALGPNPKDGAPLKAVAKEFDYCHAIAQPEYGVPIPRCLQELHDEMMSDVTEKVWKGLGAGG